MDVKIFPYAYGGGICSRRNLFIQYGLVTYVSVCNFSPARIRCFTAPLWMCGLFAHSGEIKTNSFINVAKNRDEISYVCVWKIRLRWCADRKVKMYTSYKIYMLDDSCCRRSNHILIRKHLFFFLKGVCLRAELLRYLLYKCVLACARNVRELRVMINWLV